MKFPQNRLLLAISTLAMLGSCAPVENAVLGKVMSMAANDQIMLIREDPPSFGYLRLESQVREFSDLGVFVSQKGMPDFFAETTTDGRKYFILYPITDKEFSLLDGFRSSQKQAPKKI
jgi:hypothetical protein